MADAIQVASRETVLYESDRKEFVCLHKIP